MNETFVEFKDWANPTKDELKKWAYSDHFAPEQDFELMVVDDPEFILGFASDPKCPKRDFFLGSLYVWVGDNVCGVRGGLVNMTKVEKLLSLASMSSDPALIKFVERSRNLIKNPENYDYENWGLSGVYILEAYK